MEPLIALKIADHRQRDLRRAAAHARRTAEARRTGAIGPVDWLRRIVGRSPRSSTRITHKRSRERVAPPRVTPPPNAHTAITSGGNT
jgi:hypothetical protein